MTVPTSLAPLLPASRPQDDAGCVSCPHPLADHDPIGLRFCRATRAGDITRGCVCRTA
jgi:hypothetical protein